jgi:hypothetical protein
MHIIGHHKERERLAAKAKADMVAQSYLFSGPDSIGKSLCAMEFACSLAGEPDFEPEAAKEAPFDVMIVRPMTETKRGVTKTKSISAEEVRDALSFLGKYPVAGKYRIVIIADAHKLSVSAQNVLLKTLEEPNTSAVIILVTHEPGSLLSTLLSRVEHIRFGLVSEEEMRSGIPDQGSVPGFFFSLGRPGAVIRAVDDPEAFAGDKELLGSLFRLSTLPLAERLALAERMAGDVPRAIRMLEWWLPGLHASAKKTAEPGATARFFALLDETEQMLRLLKTTQSNARLLLEKLFLSV